jgi:cullin-associated NEDD8-dissociated protein 1
LTCSLACSQTAYECMHTLLDTCLKEIEIHEFLGRVLRGLSDEEEVKKLCYLMLVKLAQIAPTAVTQRESTSSAFVVCRC